MSNATTCKRDGGCPQCNPVFAALIAASPRDQAQFQMRRRQAELGTLHAHPASTPLTVATANEPPAPPSLISAVGGPDVPMAPVFGGGPRRRPFVAAAAAGDVPAAPSLTDAIVAARKGGR